MEDAGFLVNGRRAKGLVIAGGAENDHFGWRFRIRELCGRARSGKITGKIVVMWI